MDLEAGSDPTHPSRLLDGRQPIYSTLRGAAYASDSLKLLKALPNESIKAVITSPPYALHFQKEYGNVPKEEYVEWLLPFAYEIRRILVDDGSFVLIIGGSYNPGEPTRSLYHFRLLLSLCDDVGFHLAQECFWYNPGRLPTPAQWVAVRRSRIKDSVEYAWWLSPTPWPDADNRRVLVNYSRDMKRLLQKGYVAKARPSGHKISTRFANDREGAIPSNLIVCGNNDSNSQYMRKSQELGLRTHPARFPEAVPRFFIELVTKPSEIILDPFAGSNTTGAAAERLNRRWLACDINEDYVRASAVRFQPDLQGDAITGTAPPEGHESDQESEIQMDEQWSASLPLEHEDI